MAQNPAMFAVHSGKMVATDTRFDREFFINSGRLQECSPREEVAHA